MIKFLIIFLIFRQTLSQVANNSFICFCVTAGNCGVISNTDGSGQIDIRIVNVRFQENILLCGFEGLIFNKFFA
jgi:hypothetical protein